ncbi:MAG: ATP-binding protein [Clostridia bacterium]|nr:ATP-binding protein [Clostridia bacterium]
MELQRLLSQTRKAIDEYSMIKDGDKIAVGISGGKDSLTMLYALQGLRRFYPARFDIEAITVSAGIDGMDFTPVQELCKELNVNYTIINTDIYDIVYNIRKETNPCALCAKLRKGAFNDKAKELGCNKIAYAHHKDDVIETLLMSLFLEGRVHTFSPVTYLDRTGLTLIRPLIYIDEADVIGFKNKYNLPIVKNLCPADGETKREYAKQLLKNLNKDIPGVRERIFTAILNGGFDGWDKRVIRRR